MNKQNKNGQPNTSSEHTKRSTVTLLGVGAAVATAAGVVLAHGSSGTASPNHAAPVGTAATEASIVGNNYRTSPDATSPSASETSKAAQPKVKHIAVTSVETTPSQSVVAVRHASHTQAAPSTQEVIVNDNDMTPSPSVSPTETEKIPVVDDNNMVIPSPSGSH